MQQPIKTPAALKLTTGSFSKTYKYYNGYYNRPLQNYKKKRLTLRSFRITIIESKTIFLFLLVKMLGKGQMD